MSGAGGGGGGGLLRFGVRVWGFGIGDLPWPELEGGSGEAAGPAGVRRRRRPPRWWRRAVGPGRWRGLRGRMGGSPDESMRGTSVEADPVAASSWAVDPAAEAPPEPGGTGRRRG
jgi:hypothetical protein